VRERVFIPGLPEVDEDSCCRSMDFLLECEKELAETVCFGTAELLDLNEDLIFFDGSSTYWETDQEDPDQAAEDGEVKLGFRSYGHSKDHQPVLAQVLIGIGVTREGIPINLWSWPGTTGSRPCSARWGMTCRLVAGPDDVGCRPRIQLPGQPRLPVPGRRELHHRGDAAGWLQGCGPGALLARAVPRGGGEPAGRGGGAGGDLFVIWYNPDKGVRDSPVREWRLQRLEEELVDSDQCAPAKRAELLGKLKTKPGLSRLLQVTKGGPLRVDRAAVAHESHLDGKYLVRTSDPTMTADEVALGYKQLLQVGARVARHEWSWARCTAARRIRSRTPGATSATTCNVFRGASSEPRPAAAFNAPRSSPGRPRSTGPSRSPSRHASSPWKP
jgi:hypothetical protein